MVRTLNSFYKGLKYKKLPRFFEGVSRRHTLVKAHGQATPFIWYRLASPYIIHPSLFFRGLLLFFFLFSLKKIQRT